MPPNEERHHDDFLRLFAVNEPALRAFVRSLVPRREDVPEVMQEVAVVLWRKFGDLPATGDFRKWAFGVARLEALAWARGKARDRHVFDSELLATLADAAESSSHRMGAQREALEDCLGKLPEARRQLVLSAYAPGTSIQQMAVQRGQTPWPFTNCSTASGWRWWNAPAGRWRRSSTREPAQASIGTHSSLRRRPDLGR